MPERRFQYFWCDGFIPSDYLLEASPSRIAGRAWICNGDRQDVWDFVLLLPRTYTSREDIDWASLLSAPSTTAWMDWDEGSQHLELDPGVAVPERE